MKPAEVFFEAAKAADVGILARVPLASGLLTGKITRQSTFDPGDHRQFNRNGEAFDKGETFSGVDFELGLQAVEELKQLFAGQELAQVALQWILMFDAVSCVIPGASKVAQVHSNVAASGLPSFDEITMTKVKEIYDRLFWKEIHHLW